MLDKKLFFSLCEKYNIKFSDKRRKVGMTEKTQIVLIICITIAFVAIVIADCIAKIM